ncbi:MAG: Flp family type IVb pilin [Bdellovibrionales bacterium]
MPPYPNQQKDKEKGATSIEYALIAGILTTAIAATLYLLGGNLTGRFESIVSYFK